MRKITLVVLLFMLFGSVTAQDTWTWTQRYNGPKHLNDVAAGADGLFVAVGNDGAILTSSDGVDWIERNSNTHHGLHRVIWGDGMFVAGGDSGTIITSGDGVEWVVRKVGGNESIRSIAWGNGKYIADIGNGLRVLISENGIEWIDEQTMYGGYTNFSMPFVNFVYGDGLFMSGYGDCSIPVSTDGINWEHESGPSFYSFGCSSCRSSPPILSTNLACMPSCPPGVSVAYGNGIFLLLAGGGWGTPRGLARYERSSAWEIIDYDCDWIGRKNINGYNVIYDGTLFIIIGSNGIYFTENGNVFKQISTKSLRDGTSMAYNGNVYVTVNGTEIGTLSEGFTSIVNQKQAVKSVSNFTIRQNGKILKITFTDKNLRPQIKLFNIVGKRQKIKPVFNNDGTISLSVSHLALGLYVLSVNDKKENWQKQIMVR